jgi:tetratricopeptide (TPR) repeat protein
VGRHSRTKKGTPIPATPVKSVRSRRRALVGAACVAAALLGAGYGIRLWHHASAETANAAASSPREGDSAVRSAVGEIPRLQPGDSALDRIAALKREQLAVAQELCRVFPALADPRFFLGKVYQHQGENREAVKCWEQGLAIDARRPEAHVGLGWIAMLRGDQAEAIAEWQQALALNPKLPDVNNALGRALMSLGKTREAIAAFERDVAAAPKSDASLFLLGQSYLQLKEYAKAKEYYERAIALDPAATNAYFGLMQAAQRLGEKELAEKHRAKFQELKAREMDALKERDLAYKDLAESERETSTLLGEAGRIWASVSRPEKAEALWRRGAEIDARAVDCRLSLAALYERAGKLAAAIARHEEVRKLDARNVLCRLALGQLYVRVKGPQGFADAETALKEALTAAPDEANAMRDLARLYLRARVNLPEARTLAERAAALEPSAANLSVLSRACHMNGDRPQALALLKRAVDLEPANEEYRTTYARMLAAE